MTQQEMALKLVRRPKGPFGLVDHVHALQGALAKRWGRPTNAMRTDLTCDGKPVIFLHNPKTGGKSLRQFLHVKRDSHALASERLSPRHWQVSFSIVAVREPFERFLSNYYDRVLKQNDNALVRLFGPEFKRIDAFGFLEVLKEMPVFGGPQVLWTDYPLAVKPRADLVLRYENIADWKDQLLASGLAVADRNLPHINRSKRSESNHLEALRLSQSEFERLEAAVKDHFHRDYDAFGYPL
ncbi:Sulfotransferase [Paracoccaceae bacterium]